MSHSTFKSLEDKVDSLIKLCDDIRRENQMLRDRESHWKHEKETLLSKNNMARVRLEKVLRRLKTLEQGQV
jgi:cell division protein ZapB